MKNILVGCLLATSLLFASNSIAYDKILRGVLFPKQVSTYKFYFVGKYKVNFVLRGHGKSDIDCYMYNKSWQLIKLDESEKNNCNLSLFPIDNQSYYLVIKNNGNFVDRYELMLR